MTRKECSTDKSFHDPQFRQRGEGLIKPYYDEWSWWTGHARWRGCQSAKPSPEAARGASVHNENPNCLQLVSSVPTACDWTIFLDAKQKFWFPANLLLTFVVISNVSQSWGHICAWLTAWLIMLVIMVSCGLKIEVDFYSTAFQLFRWARWVSQDSDRGLAILNYWM